MKIYRPLLVSFTVVVEIETEEGADIFDQPIPIVNELETAINQVLEDQPINYGYISSRFVELDSSSINSGRCAKCGAWVTDREKSDAIDGLQNGASVDGVLLCDDCLPKDHRWAF